MPLIGLFVKADLENIEKVDFSENTIWTLDVKNAAGEETREGVTVDPQEEFDMPNSKGTCNFLIKWEGAKQASTMSVITPTRSTGVKELKKVELGSYTAADSGEFKPMVVFDCRGIEPCGWSPAGAELTVRASEKKEFSEVRLEGDEWFEYDDTAEVPVSIQNLKFEFRAMR
mmetsp:Transcript_123372/g.226346  ORF Transcript_123372/g.226346 Transcript_123372/m.226346 type:complete len:172 (-) Transcript_123372:71-586(-)